MQKKKIGGSEKQLSDGLSSGIKPLMPSGLHMKLMVMAK